MMKKYSFFKRKEKYDCLREVISNLSLDRNKFLLKFRKTCYFLCLISMIAANVNAQVTYTPDQKWQWLHPKPQGNILTWCKLWDANNWYIAGQFGVFMKTSNAGLTWTINYNSTRLDNLERSTIRDAHFFNSDTGIIVGDNSSVFKTTNGGISFDSIPNLFVEYGSTWESVFFMNSNTGYITGNGKFIKSSDGGISWSFINSISSSQVHFDAYSFNDTLLIVASASGRIQRSVNGGLSWDNMIIANQNNLYKLCFINKDTGFVCGAGGTVLLTTNAGLNWENVNSGLPTTSFLDIDYKINGNSKEIYLTGYKYCIYRTTNFGSSWDSIGFWGENQTDMGINQKYTSTDFGFGDTLLTVGYFGLINKRNSVNDKTLLTSFTKFGLAEVYDVCAIGDKIWGVGQPTISNVTFDQIIFSSNGGNSWIVQNSSATNFSYSSIDMLNENTGFVVGTNGAIRKTMNGGNLWENISSPTSSTLQKVEFVSYNTGWIFGNNRAVFKTTDSGNSWNQQVPEDSLMTDIYCSSMLNENTGWMAGYYGKMCKTTNGGINWFELSSPMNTSIYNIKMINSNTGYISGYLKACKTTDGGNNWVTLTLPISDFQIRGMDFIDTETGMLLNLYNTFKTTNGGVSWLIDNTGTLSGYNQESFQKLRMVSLDTAFICGKYAGILKYNSLSTIGLTEWQNTIPNKFILFQNYPNPFNPSTTIKFAIPKQSKVLLKVYDITGKEVRTIFDIELNAGTITHQFDGSELASGIYFYSLYIDGTRIDTKKMVLVK